MKDIYQNARKLMEGFCKVCRQCNGKACAGEVPGMGGLGTGTSFFSNIESLAKIKFNMRLVHGVTTPTTSTTILGKKLELPVLAAPIGGVAFNMGGGVSEEDYIRAIVNGCHNKGILGCTGDGAPAFIHESGFDAIQAIGGNAIAFIKPWEDKELFEKLEKAEKTGATIVGMDIDAAGLVTLRQMGRPVSPRTPAQLGKIISSTPMKFILKGIMTVDEARLAVDAGADAIVVSNHGGRVFDSLPGAADVLQSIASGVGDKITILADGGVRSGGDVLKLLALGADAVMIGRPFSIAAVGGLQKGVETYIDKIKAELIQSMVLTGSQTISDINESILFKKDR
ncbi:MAG: alpha-hydroxy-acid oxidizing protein [Desulfobacteraceae bacterium]|nr:alpha-hydroxy-acid oxidizing protein [Desulfobacteraceae bacterium]